MAPFSFIKTSTLIFAYLFLWYQTNDHHQVSALSTLNDDDDVSDGSGLYSSEEDIDKTHNHLKTLESDGTNGPHKGYGDNHPPQGRGEPSLRRGGVGSSASSPLKRGGGGTSPPFGGQYPHPTRRYGTPKKDHVNSKYGTPKKDHVTSNFGTQNFGSPNFGTLNSGTPKNKGFSQRSKRVKDVLKALWKKCVCQGNKHPRWMMFFAVVIVVILYSLFMCYAKISRGKLECFLQGCKGVIESKEAAATITACAHGTAPVSQILVPAVFVIVVVAILGLLIGCYYFKSLEKYIQSKSQH